MNLIAKGVAMLLLVAGFNKMIAQSKQLLHGEAYTLELTMPKCHGMAGTIQLSSETAKSDITYSFDNYNFYELSSPVEIDIGYHNLIIQRADQIDIFEIHIMPMEDISFDFIEVTPAKCNGTGGRIRAAVTGSGTATFPMTGSGTIFVNTEEFGDVIDLELDAGEYIISAVLNEAVRRDTLILIPKADCRMYIPNAFSPNADLAGNQTFAVGFEEDSNPLIKKYLIYDRWGNKVYERRDINATEIDLWWDGMCRGKPCQAGPYSYRIEVEFEAGGIIQETGTVTLL